MATTEQRTGFRLPWASDVRSTTPDDDAGPATDRGEAEEPAAEATGANVTWPAADTPRDAAQPAPHADVADDDHAPAPAVASTAAPAPAHGRRDNPLVTGLVRAMRDAAIATRQESATRFAEEAKAQVEAIHVHSADEVARLRKQAEGDIADIRDWSKAEMARVRQLTESKIADRRRLLEADVDALSARVEQRIEQVRGAVDAFEQQMDAFFERLLAEEDPTRLAGLAEQLPEPPVLEIDISGPVRTNGSLDPVGAAAAEAEALGEIDTLDDDGSDEAATADLPVIADVARRLDALSQPAPAAPEPATSRVAVTGLASVASIAGFKRALTKSPGVRAVSVASGPTGEFIFTVAHEPETDLRSVVPLFDGFAAVVAADGGELITVSATDPERAK